jgi:tryptophan 2,3-dioxygenase
MHECPTAALPRAGELTYSSYLRLEQLLSQQVPYSDSHDEPLFILTHQASELWFKLCLHELEAARDCVRRDDVRRAFKMLARVSHIQVQLIHSWDVLGTMTPTEYLSFRAALGSSSGFQSLQYRLLEFLLGGKDAAHIERFRGDPAVATRLRTALITPSLYDEALRLLARRGVAVPEACLLRDFTQPYVPCPEVEAAWANIYRDPEQYWDLYELGERLVDLEDRFQRWRYAHLRTVERIIGRKQGTGGTPGVSYLAKVLDRSFFPELFSVRGAL